MNNSRNRIASRGSGRLKPQTPADNFARSMKLPQISTSLSSTEDSNVSLWSPSRPPGYVVGVCSQQGKRPYQEDQYSIKQFVHTQVPTGKVAPETHMFGLFDGHAGGRCSTHLATNLSNVLVEEESFVANLPLALKRSFYSINEQFLKNAEKNKWHDGSTGNVAVIRDGKLTVANVGDCRAVLISNGRALQMSNDHKPTNPEEQKRIAGLGGTVVYCMGVARVNKVLAVSRAFGNRTLRQVIRPDAELMQRELVPGDDFLVMASDGLWDVLRNKDVTDMCYASYLQRRPQAIADELVNLALTRGSMDNVTCIVVHLADYRPLMDSSLATEDVLRRSLEANSSAHAGQQHLQQHTSFGSHLMTESIVDQQQLSRHDHDGDDDDTEGNTTQPSGIARSNTSSAATYSACAGPRMRTAGGSSNSNSNNYPAHDIPSKQRSLGTINPRDLPTFASDSDPFGVKQGHSSNNNSTRVPLFKAVSTNSMSSQDNLDHAFHENGVPSSYSASSSSANMTSFGSDKSSSINPALGFLRPLTALDTSLPMSSSGSGSTPVSTSNKLMMFRNNNSNSNHNIDFAGSNASNGFYPSSSAASSAAMSSSQKLAQVRAMKSPSFMPSPTSTSSNNFGAMTPTTSSDLMGSHHSFQSQPSPVAQQVRSSLSRAGMSRLPPSHGYHSSVNTM
jgi:protein phosphatase 1L